MGLGTQWSLRSRSALTLLDQPATVERMSSHAPEPRTPRPAESRESEVYTFTAADGTITRFHTLFSAAEYLGVSVRSMRLLGPLSERYGPRRVWREDVLDEQKAIKQPLRSRGAAPTVTGRSREEAASATHTKHPRWSDGKGNSFAASEHPNYELVRQLMRTRWDSLCEEWRTNTDCPVNVGCACQVAYAVERLIGMKPGKHYRLETIEPGQQFAPDTVLWWFEQWRSTVAATAALKRKAKGGNPAAMLELRSRLSPPRESVVLYQRQRESARQRGECDCTRLYECDDHAAARRAGDEYNEGPLLPEDGEA